VVEKLYFKKMFVFSSCWTTITNRSNWSKICVGTLKKVNKFFNIIPKAERHTSTCFWFTQLWDWALFLWAMFKTYKGKFQRQACKSNSCAHMPFNFLDNVNKLVESMYKILDQWNLSIMVAQNWPKLEKSILKIDA